MNFLPKSKDDIDSCKNLNSASEEEINDHIGELLFWLQDFNWPVPEPVLGRIIALGEKLAEPVREILEGNDDIWKYWIVSRLLCQVNSEVVFKLRHQLLKIAFNPTNGEAAEGVDTAIKEHLSGVLGNDV